MKNDRVAWRDITNIASAGLGDLFESMLVCLILFVFFALLGCVGSIELYSNIVKKVALAVTITTFGLRMSNEIKNHEFTICIYVLIVINIALSSILVMMNILS